MILEAIKYTRMKGNPKEWTIEGCDGNMVHFGNLNLLVGKNASGKSRTLTVIKEVGGLISGSIKLSEVSFTNAEYDLVFKENEDVYEYSFSYKDRLILEETLKINNEQKFKRSANTISFSAKNNSESVAIENDILSTSLHNVEKYLFLENIFQWGNNLKVVAFTNQYEKNHLLKDLSQFESTAENLSIHNPKSLLHVFFAGCKLFGDTFTAKIIEDMKELDYPLETIDILNQNLGYGIYVKEDELDELTSQLEMSQGMFRALAFVIQLNFAIMSKMSVCILIDDLGEGLDYDRSKQLIGLLIKNINGSDIQIFTTSNDRYIMNKLPLKYWSVIERCPKKSVFYNYYNSKDIFEDFKYTGLNNFDFLASDFYLKGFSDIEE